MSSLRISVDCDESHIETSSGREAPAKHTWVDHLLEAVSVVSVTRGRMRFHIDMPGDEILTDCLRREVQKQNTARLGSYSVRTKTALVTFDENVTSDAQIAAAVLRGVMEFARLHGECDLTHHHHGKKGAAHEEDCDHDHTSQVTDAGIKKELLKLIVTGGALGFFVYKRLRNPLGVNVTESPLSLATFITLASGYPILRDGYDAVSKKGKATDDTLIGIAVTASLLLGESLTGLSVVWLIQLGRILELITLKRSRTAVKELMDITPTEAWLVAHTDSKADIDVTKKVEVDQLKKGDTIRVFHGEKVALDGVITRGQALIKESFLTGESIPKQKTVGDTVYAGSILEVGEIDVKVTSLQNDTVVATMIDAIENLRDKKAPIEKVGQKFASKFVPISLGLSVITFLVTKDIRRAITMLVIACPCAAGLATPTAVTSSIGQLARKGILVKGGTHLETAARVDAVIFDKTGTLTLGSPTISNYVATSDGESLGADETLRLAASAEQHTTHPLGRVLVSEARKRKLELSPVGDFKIHEGLGISGLVDNKQISVGSKRFMTSIGVKISKATDKAVVGNGAMMSSMLYLAVGEKLVGVYVVEDALRPEAPAMLAKLKTLGIKRFILATGDQKATAELVANKLGITEWYAEMLPVDKLELVKKLKGERRKVAMMGDGVNDAQALAEADLSIAMGASRCDVAIETADVTIARDDLGLVADLFDASRKTLRAIYQNFVAAVGINAGGMVYGAAGQLTPFFAAIVHNASTIAVVINSLRLGRTVGGTSPLTMLKEVNV